VKINAKKLTIALQGAKSVASRKKKDSLTAGGVQDATLVVVATESPLS